MKKILFLFILCIVKLNAYNYLFYENLSGTGLWKYGGFINENGKYYFWIDQGNSIYKSVDCQYIWLYAIKHHKNDFYISNSEFQNLYKNDLELLNNFYTSTVVTRNVFFNYLYNENEFNNDVYINYNDYELLYNSDGLAVESLVNGVYAGLYNMDEMQFSGNLYNENGDLVLVNGVEPSFFQVLCDKLIGDLHLKMLDAENLIDKGWIFAVALTFAIFYLIARTLKRVLMGKNNKGVENES